MTWCRPSLLACPLSCLPNDNDYHDYLFSFGQCSELGFSPAQVSKADVAGKLKQLVHVQVSLVSYIYLAHMPQSIFNTFRSL